MTEHDDPRLARFARGELAGAELEAFELELDQRPSLREALAALVSRVHATTVPAPTTSELEPARRELTFGRELGRGGMAIVSLAVQHGLEREVAVKRARRDQASDDVLLVQEARLTGALEHPAIVPVHALAWDDGRPMVVLKRVEGEPWSSLLRAPELVEARYRQQPLEWHLRVLCTVCDALSFAHARQVIHRDVKPGNVMIGTFGEVYVTDWGLGGLVTPDPAGRLPCVADTAGAGTPAYMSPEQLELKPLTVATDLWLLGGCLFEVLYGRPPFGARTREERLASSQLGVQLEPGPRADLLGVVQRALAVSPQDRFTSAQEFKRALEECLRHADSERLEQTAAHLREQALEHRKSGRKADAEAAATETAHTLRASLSLWSDNQAARARSLDLLKHRVTWALEDEQPAVAQKLLSEHAAPPAELVERVRASVDEAARLQAHARGLNPAIGRRQRVTFLLGVVVMMVVFNSARLLWPAFYASRWSLALSSVAFLVGFLALALAHRRLISSSTLNGQLAKLVTITTIAQISTRTTAAMMGWSRGQALTVDLSVIALTLMIGAGVFHWSFGVGAVICLVGQALALTFPTAAEPLFALTSVLAIAGVALGLGFWRKSEAA